MSVVDERVVRMEFDNKQFEQNIKQSIKSLDDLDKQLGLVSDDDAFDNIDKSSKKIDFKNLLSGLNSVSKGFSALEMVAIGALTKIGSKITDVVSKYSGLLTFKQIGEGWNKYAEYSTATQTTMAATSDTWEKGANNLARLEFLNEKFGDESQAKAVKKVFDAYNSGKMSVNEVAKALQMSTDEVKANMQAIKDVTMSHEEYVERSVEQLNWYSDETSYNFTDMISTISKFTATGQSLEDSTQAVQGMMNMVAKAGGNAQIGVRAAMQFSQAMSTGAMKLQDWRSLENMNVATKEFRQELIDAAVAAKKLKKVTKDGKTSYQVVGSKSKETFTATKGFDESLKHGWANTKVLNKTLKRYGEFSNEMYKVIKANDEYGITTTETLDNIDAYQEAMAKGKNSEEFKAFHKDMVDLFDGDTEAADKYIKSLKKLGSEQLKFSRDAFEEGQKAKTFKDAIDATADAVSTKWSNIFKYMFGSSERAKEFWSNLCETLYDIFAEPLDNVLKIFAKLKKNFKIFDGTDQIDAFEAFRRSIQNLGTALVAIITPIRAAFRAIFMKDAPAKLAKFSQAFLDFSKKLIITKDQAKKLQHTFEGLFGILKGVGKAIGAAFKIIKPIFRLISPIARLIGVIASKIGLVADAINEVSDSDAASLVDRIASAVGKAVDWIAGKLDALTTWIDENIDFDALVNTFTAVKSFFVSAWNAIKNAAVSAWERISPFIPTFEQIKSALSSVWETVKAFLPTWKQVVSGLKKGWQAFTKVAQTIWKFVYPYIQKLGEAFKKFGKTLLTFVKGLFESDDKWQYFKDNILGVVKAFSEWKKNSKFIKWLIGQFENLKTVLKDIKEFLKPSGDGSKTGQLFAIGYSIASLIALIALLRNIKRITKGFANISAAVKKFSKVLNKVVLFVGIYLVVKAITALINALEKFSQLSFGQIAAGIGSVIILGAGILAFAAVMKKITKEMTPGEVKSFSKVTAMLSIALLAITASLWLVSQSNGEGLIWKVLSLIILMTAVVMAAYAMSKYVGDIKMKSLLAFVILAGVLLVAAIAIQKLGSLGESEFEKARNIILILGGIALAAIVIGAVLKSGSEAMKNIAIAIGIMAAALLLIVISLKLLKGVNLDLGMVGLILSIIAIIGVLAAIPVVMGKIVKGNMLKSSDILKMAGTVTLMTTSLMLIAIALGLLAKTMAKAGVSSGDMLALSGTLAILMIALGAMAIMLAVATKILGDSDSKAKQMKQAGKAVRSMVISILLMAAALALLVKLKINFKNSAGALAVLGSIALGLGVLAILLGTATRIAGSQGLHSGALIGMVIGIIAIVVTLMTLTKFMQKNGDSINAALITMGWVALGLAALMLAMGGATRLAGAKGLQTGPILVMMLGIVAIMHMMIIMSAVGADQLKAVSIVMGILIGGLALLMIAMGILQSMSDSTGNTVRAIAMVAVAVLALIALVMIMKQLQDIDISWDILAKFGLMAAGLLVFVGVLVLLGGVATAGAAGILVISVLLIAISAAMLILSVAALIAAAALPPFAEGMQMLIDVISGISVSGEQLLAFAIIAIFASVAAIGLGVGALFLAAAMLVGSVALAVMAAILPQLAVGLVILVTTLVMLSSVADVASSTAWTLAGAFLGLLLGGIALGIGMAAAGAGLLVVGVAAFAIAAAFAIVAISVSALIASFALLAEGIAVVSDLFTGGNMSDQVSTFAENIKTSASHITDSMTELKNNLKSGDGLNLPDMLGLGGDGINLDFSNLKSQITNGLTGEGGIFGGDLTSMFSGDLTSAFSGGIEGLDMSALTGALGDKFTGSFDLTSVLGDLNLGEDFTSSLTSGIDGVDMSSLNSLLGDKFSGGFDLSSILSGSGFSEQLSSALTSGVSEADAASAGQQAATELAGGINSGASMSEVKSAGTEVAKNGVDGAESTKNNWKTAGGNLGASLASGINSKGASVKSYGKSVGNKGKEGAESTKDGWKTAGQNCVTGLVNGIKSKLSEAYAAGKQVGQQATAGAKEGAGESSPSKFFMEIGEYMVEGLVIGIDRSTKQAVQSTKEMALATVGTASQILSNAIENDYANPVIRPTLDLTNVTDGASKISSLFGNQAINAALNGVSDLDATGRKGGVVYNYTQNNYSPKALNRIDIYRQTKNQLNSTSILAKV